MKQAEKFGRPVVCIVDTAGAYCGIGAEERGQGMAIAKNMMEMMTLKTPVVSIVISEGGSGGAIALSVADEVWMLENAVYSVISPEGAASIIWKDASKVKEASENLKMTAQDLLKLGIIERIFDEPEEFPQIYEKIREALAVTLNEKMAEDRDKLLFDRYRRFRKFGEVTA
jgi:acetyl-CoA carboxylase carboxyl transferase subunit alpha